MRSLSARFEGQMLRTFGAILDDVRDNGTVAQLARLIEQGRVEDVLDLLRLDAGTWAPLAEQIRQVYMAGGKVTADALGRIPDDEGLFTARFDARSPQAERWLSEKSSTLIVEIVNEQREAARIAIRAGLERGDNPRTTALDLIGRVNQATGRREGGFIALTSGQAEWVNSARDKLDNLDPSYFDMKLRDKRLDPVIRQAMAAGHPVPRATVESAITRYQARAQRYRGEVIARTETLNALRASQNEAVRQAAEEAGVEAGEAVKVWSSTGDERTREAHLEMDGQEVMMNEPFETPDGELLMYPGDSSMGASAANTIQCRCSVSYRINFGAMVKRVEGI